ncbi:hypothetical protein WSS_A10252 [Rhodococcus opacus M213]|uniref:Uncharacterized protein n=1 Tax=Rhodococcus opacus M213 TaxID=1129896 RepID=K8XZX7_RHOOP|nr:hypothetical protein WSS_A10252 [Rhodococcus opacus M213]
MGFSADPSGAAALVAAGNAPLDACEVVGSELVEQPAIATATPTASTAARVAFGVRHRRPPAVRLGTFSAGKFLIAGITASAAEFDTAPMSGTSWADLLVHPNPDARPLLRLHRNNLPRESTLLHLHDGPRGDRMREPH